MEAEVKKIKTINVEFLGQLVNSMDEAVDKLKEAKEGNKIAYSNKIKKLILDIQKKIREELSK